MRSASRLADIAPFHVMELLTRAKQLEAAGRDIIHMEVGEPDFPTPKVISDAAIEALRSHKPRYTHALGLLELRPNRGVAAGALLVRRGGLPRH